MPTQGRLVPKIGLALLFLGISLSVIEVAYRWILESQGFTRTATSDQYQFYRYDSELGWANAPGLAGIFERPEFSYPIQINQHGMRQREIATQKPAGTTRIAVLGDSFVWGIGVPDEDRLTELVEKELPSTEVLNFGVSGYAPVQYHLMAPRVMPFDPDFIVLVFCLGNDFVDNVTFMGHGRYKPYAELEDGVLSIRGYPIPNSRVFGYAAPEPIFGSVVIGSLHALLTDSSPPQAGLVEFEQAFLYQPDDRLSPDARLAKASAIAINKALLKETARSFEREGLDLVVVSAPSKREFNLRGETGHTGYYDEAENILKQTCMELGIPFLPTVDKLTGEDFWDKDGHWSRSGHAKMASAISSYLSESGKLKHRR